MNPLPEDPNNHAPPITPGDDWDDLDGSTERSRIGLPPKRAERGLPPKKESLAEKVSLRMRMMAIDSGEGNPTTDPAGSGEEESQPEGAEGIPRKKHPSNRSKQVRKPKPDNEAVPEPSGTQPGESGEAAVVLPHPKMAKRGKVNEINPAGDKPVSRSAVVPAAIVARVPSAEPDADAQDAVRKRRRFLRGERPDWGANEKGRSMRWMLLAGLGVTVLVILAVVMNQRPKGGRMKDREQSLYSSLALAEEEIDTEGKIPDGLDKLVSGRPEAEAIFAAYAGAKSPDDFTGFIHAPARNRELIESKWKPLGMEMGLQPGSESAWYVKEEGGMRFAILEGILADFTAFRAFFRQDGEGKLKMDWKATSGYCSADFAELKSGKGDGSEVRVWLSQADFYTFSFPESEYRAFRVMSPKGDATIWGYVPSGSDLEKELLELFLPGQITGELTREIQAIVSLGPSDGDALPDQWLISDIVRTDWLDE